MAVKTLPALGAVRYAEFLSAKSHLDSRDGFKPLWMPDFLYPFQKDLTAWAIEQGRGAIFEDCGLGKTPQEQVWAQNVVQHTNGNVLILCPPAVAPQMVIEGQKFGIEVHHSRDGKPRRGITATNYQQLHKFDPNDFAGIVIDESSCLKDMKGVRQGEVSSFMRKIRYRLAATATPSPNNFIEFGTTSEALGHMGNMDMLSMFFKTDEDNLHPQYFKAKWLFKAHAEKEFWRWLCSWCRAIRRPSDMGYDDGEFVLPELITRESLVEHGKVRDGCLFPTPAITLNEQREERRLTITERCERVAELVSHDQPSIAWCHLNEEGDLLAKLIPGSVQVKGGDSDEHKDRTLMGFARGEFTKLVTKPSIAGWGLNYQHCRHMTTFPSHSFEQHYQMVRRCWRFPQKQAVTVDVVTTEGEAGVLGNLKRKSDQMDHAFNQLVAMMHNSLELDRSMMYGITEELPAWLA